MADRTPLITGDPSGPTDLLNLKEMPTGTTVGLDHGGTGVQATPGVPSTLLDQLGAAKVIGSGAGALLNPVTQMGLATSGTQGSVKLTQDLGGSGALPKVVGIHAIPITAPVGGIVGGGDANKFLQLNNAGTAYVWTTVTGGSGGSSQGSATDIQTNADGAGGFAGGSDLQKLVSASGTRLVIGDLLGASRGIIHLHPFAGNPSTSAPGEVWYNSTGGPAGIFGNIAGTVTRLTVSYDGSGLIPVSLLRPREWDRHRYILQSAPGESQYRHYGTSTAPSTLGSMTSYDDASGPWILHTSDAGATAGAGFQSPSPTLCKGLWLPDVSFKIDMPSSLSAGVRYVFGFWSQNPQWLDLTSGSGTWATSGIFASQCKYVSFIYDFDLHGTNWLAATYDSASGASGVYQNTSVGAVTAVVKLRIKYVSTTSVEFWVDNTLVHTADSSTHKVPASNVNFGLYCMGVSRDGTVATLGVQRVCLEYGS